MDIWKLVGIIIIALFICLLMFVVITLIGPSNIVDIYTGRNIAISYETTVVSQYGEGAWTTEPKSGIHF